MEVVTTRLMSLLLLVGAAVIILGRIRVVASGGPLPEIRKIAAVEAIPEVIGRATEMGRPVHFTSGIGRITDEFAPQTLAATEILGHIARVCAEYEAPLHVTVCNALVYPVQQDAVRQGYALAGKVDAYSDDQVTFASEMQMAYASSAVAYIQREKVAANIMIGAFYGETMLIAEGGVQAGAIQIGGTVRMYQLMFLAVICDYCLIGEEMFAAGAAITKDRARLGGVQGQDWVKIALVAYLVAGAALRGLLSNSLFIDLIARYGS